MSLEHKSKAEKRINTLRQKNLNPNYKKFKKYDPVIYRKIREESNIKGFKTRKRISNLAHLARQIGEYVEEHGYAEGFLKGEKISQFFNKITFKGIYEIMNLKYKESEINIDSYNCLDEEHLFEELKSRLCEKFKEQNYNHVVIREENKIIIAKK
jgi:hypothetical protein